ncbi:MAG: hypothetical protein EXS69_02515 [Candidatus Zambryskibacteria bacterium]|nr:hypothetical protein [Candidatus Zambryskibacteria bacterium]
MNPTEAFLSGNISGLEEGQPKHVVTAISNIFVFPDKAYKIYKSDSQFFNENFNDLSNKENRFNFTRKDFDWNHRLSPEIYIELKGLAKQDDKLSLVDPDDSSEELVMIMNSIDMSNQVIKKLVDGKIGIEDCYEIGKQFGQRILSFSKPSVDVTAYKDFLSRYADMIAWVKSVKEIPQDEADEYLAYVKEFIESHKEELDNTESMSLCFDVHADNAIYADGKFLPIDTYAPKEAWLYGFKNINIYRVATDFYVFLGKKAFDEVIRGYEEVVLQKLPRDWDKFMIFYCELIMWPYQYMLAEKEPWRINIADKHHQFLQSTVSQI